MKTNHLHYIVLLATIFLGCSCSEEIEKELTTGKTAVTIEVDGEEDADSRTVSFIGGTAYGEGLYDGKERPTVGAEASDGYEIDYFYGGPSDEPQKYNYTGSGSSVSYQVFLNGKDHKFKCKFKEKKRTFDPDCQSDLRRNCYRRGNIQSKNQYPHHRCCKIRIHIFRMDCD